MLVGLATPMLAWAQTDPAECKRLFITSHQIAPNADHAYAAFAVDVDGDGDVDVIAAGRGVDTVLWYENLDGAGGFGPGTVITSDLDNVRDLLAADLDGDGDVDVLSAWYDDATIAWYKNKDGLGTFDAPWIITDQAGGAASVFAADVDGDGDLDVLSASVLDYKVAWYENYNGRGAFGLPRVINGLAYRADSVFAADLDGDGDQDVLVGGAGRAPGWNSVIAWHENIDGLGTFGPMRSIAAAQLGTVTVFAADVDGDRDIDVVTAFRGGADGGAGVAWYENIDGAGTFSAPHFVSTTVEWFTSVFAVDLDGDTDIDILSGTAGPGKVSWYENRDGSGIAWARHVLAGAAGTLIFPADMDGDSDLDVVATVIQDDVSMGWYESESDCNGNGVNDGCDIADATSTDCNDNRRPDECDLADGVTLDCNANGVFDPCEPDCNFNGRPDDCDLADGISVDCNDNGLPDECEPDCNQNGRPDECDLADGSSTDCGGNGIPDECEQDCNGNSRPDDCDLADGTSSDCNGNGRPDECDPDCNGNNRADECDISDGTSFDCNYNGRPDECDRDCNNNGRADECDIAAGTSSDCNQNRWPDECEPDCNNNGHADWCDVSDGTSSDCNANHQPDECEWDCNGNRVPDHCDIADGTSPDENRNWIPDECELPECHRRFGGPYMVSTESDGATVVVAADLNGDGNLDLVSGATEGDTIAWYANTNGRGTFGPRHVITAEVDEPRSIFTIDLDGDGDVDVLSASSGDGKIAWYENVDGAGSFGPQQVIANNVDTAWSVHSADLDGDGDHDVLVAGAGHDPTPKAVIAWYENTDGRGTFGPQRTLDVTLREARFVLASDINGDGRLDVIAGGDGVAWYENTDGLGNFGTRRALNEPDGPIDFGLVSDIDGDGDNDLVLALSYDHSVMWMKNTDGRGAFAVGGSLYTEVDRAGSVHAEDFDGDGDPDLLIAYWYYRLYGQSREISWYENVNGLGVFEPRQAIDADIGRAGSIYAADFDGDGDADVLSANAEENTITWYPNETDCNGNGINDGCDIADGTSGDCNWTDVPDECEVADGRSADCNGNAVPDECDVAPGFPEHVISSEGPHVWSAVAADFDGDGDNDVVCGSYNDERILLYPNIDGLGAFGTPERIIDPGQWHVLRAVADFDGDGDQDILAHQDVEHRISLVWYENTDGAGTFARQPPIDSFAWNVVAADLDGDGDVDLATVFPFTDSVAWHENTDGRGSFGPQRVISSVIRYPLDVCATDVDGDGDLDVVVASGDGSFWFENMDGKGLFDAGRLIDTDGSSVILAEDLDGDGDRDVLTLDADFYGSHPGVISWHANLDGRGTFGPPRVVGEGWNPGLLAVDLDRDGDIDLVTSNAGCGCPRVLSMQWYENTDGLGSFSLRRVPISEDFSYPMAVATISNPVSLIVADLDGDGDADVLPASAYQKKLAWYENTVVSADCNNDDRPDECDIADGTSGDCDEDGVLDECESQGDGDADGVPDFCDVCPDSQLSDTLVLHGCDTGIVEIVLEDGCTMTESLGACDADLRNQGNSVQCVTNVAGAWKRDRIITGREYGRIVSCAARGDAGKTDEYGRGRPSR